MSRNSGRRQPVKNAGGTRPRFALPLVLALSAASTFGASGATEGLDPGRLDGVTVEAVETHLNDNSHDPVIGLGILPFDAYFNAFSANLGYTYMFTQSLGWEIVQGSYVTNVKTGLTSELDKEYGVEPDKIERLRYLASTNFVYGFAYGKLLLLDDYIKYFRGQLLVGPGMVGTTERNSVAANAAIRVIYGVRKSSSMHIEIRNMMTAKGKTEFYPALNLGVGYGF